MYRNLTLLSAFLMVVLGAAMIVVTLVHGFGIGLLLGVLFMAAGGARFWMLRRRG